MSTILLEIVTPDRLVYSEQVNSVTVRGVEGELGILPGHISFVTPLQIAPVYVKIGNQRTRLRYKAVSSKSAKIRLSSWRKAQRKRKKSIWSVRKPRRKERRPA